MAPYSTVLFHVIWFLFRHSCPCFHRGKLVPAKAGTGIQIILWILVPGFPFPDQVEDKFHGNDRIEYG